MLDCGALALPSGRLVAADPFTGLLPTGNAEIPVPPGRWPVRLTRVQLQRPGEPPHLRNAYASLLFDDAPERVRRVLTPCPPGQQRPPLQDPDEFYGFGVDAGTACFVDAEALVTAMPPADQWHDEAVDHTGADAWLRHLEDATHLAPGAANVPLPRGRAGENIALFSSGWGDGMYPLVGGYDADDQLVAVHIDFLVIPDDETVRRGEEAARAAAEAPPDLWTQLKRWWSR